MTLSDFRRITDELLSAYIDDEVTEQERALVETAIAADEEIAWRLDSMRQTVTLLRDLPELPLPRSFTLTFDQVRLSQADEQLSGVQVTEPVPLAMPMTPPRVLPKAAPAPQTEAGFWEQVQEGWRKFWQGGNPMLRNAAAVSFALMLFLASGGQLLNRALTQPAGMMASVPQAAPAAASESSAAAPAADVVALAPTATETVEAQSESLQVQEESANKTPDEPSARMMQTEDAPASEESSTENSEENSQDSVAAEAPASDTSGATNSTESVAAGSSPANPVGNPVAASQSAPVQEGEAAVAASAPSEGDAAQGAPSTEALPQVAAAMAAPPPGQGGGAGGGEISPPGPGAGGGGGGGMGETSLVPEQAYGFDVDPLAVPTSLPAEESVSASVAMAPSEEEEIAAEAVADAPATPAVDAFATPASPVAEPTAEAIAMAEQAVVESPLATPPEVIALVAPGEITSSDVVENVPSEGAVLATGPAGSLPVVWVAQGSALLLTVMLTSLWWRSRTPRRPRGQ